MVLEALAAVGLAGNICQFIDFSFQLFHTVTSIHRSGTGAPVDVQRLQDITQALQQWCQSLASYRLEVSQQKRPTAHANLYTLGENCETAAQELLSVTNALRVKEPKSKWTTFKTALVAIWSESKIKEMETRLNAYRLQLILELELMQNTGQDSIISLLDGLSTSNQQMEANLNEQISTLRKEIRLALGTLRNDLQDLSEHATERDATKASRTVLDRCETAAFDIAQSLKILDDLGFEHMQTRHHTIARAYTKTYDWIFEERMETWARSTEPVFWISGKPGSGKSTLMRYLVDDDRTPGMFRDWCGDHKLVIAAYFFWINGSALQRSQEGLLRALLYDILRQCPARIRATFPERWRLAKTGYSRYAAVSGTSWTQEELVAALQRLCTFGANNTRFCIFIDGLDEYEGDCEELVETVLSLPKLGIKLCVASRPWNVFEESFGSKQHLKIYMQDLNKSDIRSFVDGRLRTHKHFSKLTADEAEEILSEVVGSSQGVFLWVHLVVRSLLEGLRNRDNITFLRKRLESFPTDLNEFFRHMFDSLDPTYRSYLSHMFRIALSARGPLTSIAYWFLDEIEDSPDVALSLPVQRRSIEETAKKIKEVAVRINGRSKGLMEVGWLDERRIEDDHTPEMVSQALKDGPLMRVDFLHRTVRDFLLIPETQGLLTKWQQLDFQPNLAICKMMVAEFKYLAFSELSEHKFTELSITLKELFYFARKCEQEASQVSSITIYLDDLATTQDIVLKSARMAFQPEGRPTKLMTWEIWSQPILYLAAACDLQFYVHEKLGTIGKTKNEKINLMGFVLSNSAWRIADFSIISDYGIAVEALFEMVALIHGHLEDRENQSEILSIIRYSRSFLTEFYFTEGLAILLERAVINKEEFEELMATEKPRSSSDDFSTFSSQIEPQHSDVATGHGQESYSMASEPAASKEDEPSSESTAQQQKPGRTLAAANPRASSEAPTRRSIRDRVNGLVSRFR